MIFILFDRNVKVRQARVLSPFGGIDLSLSPPCRESLETPAQRANYQAFISFSIVPSPVL